MRKVTRVDAVLSSDRVHCRECRQPKGELHHQDCSVGARPEIAHRYQMRGGLYIGRPFSALPSEMEAWDARPWWRRMLTTAGMTERHFRRREAERRAGSGDSKTPRRAARPAGG